MGWPRTPYRLSSWTVISDYGDRATNKHTVWHSVSDILQGSSPLYGRLQSTVVGVRQFHAAFTGTIAKLGTEKHHRKYFEGLDTLATPGCFGMTELGHGSNVMGIETTVSC